MREKVKSSSSKENLHVQAPVMRGTTKGLAPVAAAGIKKSTSMSETALRKAEVKLEAAVAEAAAPAEPPAWHDMDAADAGDEFACAEYASFIFSYYREREGSFAVADYVGRAGQAVNAQMRALLVDWMVEVQQQLEFNHEVLYLAVKLLDLVLTRHCVEKERLQLLAAASMFVACKFEVGDWTRATEEIRKGANCLCEGAPPAGYRRLHRRRRQRL
jgi:hypothetical protein